MIPLRIEAMTAELGYGMRVRRALPTRHRRMVGPWCFLDHFGLESSRDLPGLAELRAAGLLDNRPAPVPLPGGEAEDGPDAG